MQRIRLLAIRIGVPHERQLRSCVMHDIRIPDSGGPGGGGSKKPEFEVSRVAGSEARSGHEPGDKVKVKFEKFVQLVATHDVEGVLKGHSEEDIIMSTNLLTDLANAHEEAVPESKKWPIWMVVGAILGVVATYIILRF